MNKTRQTSTVNFELLSSEARLRISTLLMVAGKRSVFSWVEAPVNTAELIMFENKNELPSISSHQCYAFLGNKLDSVTLHGQIKNLFQLEPTCTVSELLVLLDRAAIKIMDLRNTVKSEIELPGNSAEPLNQADQANPGNQPSYVYQLKRWVVLPAEFATNRYVRAMALLTHKGVTLEELCMRSDLTENQGRALLKELGKQSALVLTLMALQSEEAAPAPVTTPGAKTKEGLFGKLTRWLSQNRSTLPN